MNDRSPVSLVPNKPDAELAAEFKAKAIELHEPLLKLLDEAHAKGFQISVGCGLGPLGKYVIMQMAVHRIY